MRGGEIKEVGDYALHVSCAWRIVGSGGIVIASRDRYYPAGDPDQEPLEFKWDVPGANRCDERVAAFFGEHKDDPLLVQAIEVDWVASVNLTLSHGFVLQIFPDDSLPDEHWRLFQPATGVEHFVVTGQGIAS